jgi:hypothetical protein
VSGAAIIFDDPGKQHYLKFLHCSFTVMAGLIRPSPAALVATDGRVKPGHDVTKADPDPVKRGPYVRISKSGRVSDPIPLNGNPILRSGTP